MRNPFDTTLQHLEGVPGDFYGVDVTDVRPTTSPPFTDGRSNSMAGTRKRRMRDFACAERVE